MTLLQRIAVGDRKAADSLSSMYGPLVRKAVKTSLTNHHDIEDCVQDCLLHLLNVCERFDPLKSKESTFIYMCSQRVAWEFSRKRRLRQACPIDAPMEGRYRGFTAIDDAELCDQLLQDLKQVSLEQHEVLDLVFCQGMSRTEAAERLHVAPEVVTARRVRGIKTLREKARLFV